MRALLEVKVHPPKDLGRVPSKTVVQLPRYVGTGTRKTGSNLIPATHNADGSISEAAQRLLLEQALKHMQGHRTRYGEILPAATRERLDAYISALEMDCKKAAVRAVA